MRVLVADDTLTMRSMLAEWITAQGHEVLLAEDGEKAIRLGETAEIHIAIIDWEMPRKNGIEVVDAFRRQRNTRYSHIILITGSTDPEILIKALEGGADDFIKKPINPASFLARFRAAVRIATMREDILRLATTDPLTGVCNRRAFFERAGELLANARRRHSPLALLATDIDFFKKVNDTYGHAGGDRALVAFADTCRSLLRPLDLIGRMGGEEFNILLPDTTLAGAMRVAERLRAAFAEVVVEEGGKQFSMTVSIGVGEVSPDQPSIEPVLVETDYALYRAKENGRNRVEKVLTA